MRDSEKRRIKDSIKIFTPWTDHITMHMVSSYYCCCPIAATCVNIGWTIMRPVFLLLLRRWCCLFAATRRTSAFRSIVVVTVFPINIPCLVITVLFRECNFPIAVWWCFVGIFRGTSASGECYYFVERYVLYCIVLRQQDFSDT